MVQIRAGFPPYAAAFDIDNNSVPAVASNGHRFYVVGRSETQELVRLDASQKQFVPYLPGIPASFLNLSPDGQWITYSSPPDLSLWKSKLDGSNRLQLTFPPMQAYGPVWSPDGKRIAFHTLLPGKPGKIGIVSGEGGKPEILFADEPTAEDSQNWSPDGNVLMFGRTSLDKAGRATAESIWMFDFRTKHLTKLPQSDGIVPSVWSPDGRYVVAKTEEAHQLVLFDFNTQKWQAIASGTSLQHPLWSHDSKAIYFQDTRVSEMQPIYRYTLATKKTVEIASRKQILRSDIARYHLVGLSPKNEPIARVIRNNSDVYALDLELP